MEKHLVLTALLTCLVLPAASAGMADGFARYATAGSLKPFARDFGGILGSGLYATGRSLGFSGFDVGMRVTGQFSPSGGNTIAKNSGQNFMYLPWVQAEIGMPFRLDGFVRMSNWEGITVSGGGLRWGITKVNDRPYALQAMLVGAGHTAVNRSFSATHFSGNLVVSMKTPWTTPYIGAGLDHTRLMVMEATANPELVGADITTNDYRATVGLHTKIARFGYLNAAFNFMHGEPGMEAAAGLRF
ncbi:MAG: hypothetical protein PHW69_04040 [Elusimicrobiaceae bacterium]|nr:hypothetical protein [Elusimicrobiaceae bacterium]